MTKNEAIVALLHDAGMDENLLVPSGHGWQTAFQALEAAIDGVLDNIELDREDQEE